MKGGMNLTDDNTLCKRLRKKDESALEEIMQKYIPLISSVIFNIGRVRLRKEDMEEVLTDTFITLWKNSDKARGESLKGYLCCIAKTKTLDKMDTIRKEADTDIDEIDPADDRSIEYYIEQKEINRVLGEIVDSLGSPDNEIITRYYYYYQRIPDIAAVMGMTPENVKIRLYRARKQIRKLLEERGYEHG